MALLIPASEKCYNREEMTEQITSNGGTVVESPLHCEASYDDIFCISDGPCRKLKFLSSLAVGIACLSYLFVNDCVKKVRALPVECGQGVVVVEVLRTLPTYLAVQ